VTTASNTGDEGGLLDEALVRLREDRIPARRLCRIITNGRSDEVFQTSVREALRARFELLETEPRLSDDSLNAWRRHRGYRLEELLVGLMALEGLQPEPSSRTSGAQIDAFFELNGRYFLVEAKWTSKRQPASVLYEFRGKVDGKLVGTVGVFVSMAGFSRDASTALAVGKAMQVILVDGDDVRSVFAGEVRWRQLIELKCRKAAYRGSLYYTWKQEKDVENV
jgi:hypothetical protein